MSERANLDVVPGTLDLLILKTLAFEPMHGWGIGQRIERVSGVFSIRLGSLYPALDRLERDGLIDAAWQLTENKRRARYYRLTRAGRRRLQAEEEQWGMRVVGISRILQSA
ncbi:MAG: PadR family transcriptional regulator [Gemmatimonadota bacterium]